MERVAAAQDTTWCISEVDIFCDLSPAEMDEIAAALPLKTFAAGEVVYSPHTPVEVLFILKRGRVRIFRVSPEGRALTTAIVVPGTIFGEMPIVGQRMYQNYAEAIDETVVCVMGKQDVQRYLLADARVAARLTETLGRRLAEMERRLTETVFKSVPQRIASTLVTLAAADQPTPLRRRGPVVTVTHEQLAALVGTSRETTTKVLGELADTGLVKLGRGRITILDLAGVKHQCGD